jgi:nuclease S1
MKFFLLLVLLLPVSSSSLAFGRLGHYVTCEIALLQLSETSAAKVTKLAKSAGFDSFAQSCNWADEIRSDKHYDFAKPHHYVNVSRHTISFSSFSRCPAHGCIIDAITAYRRLLSGGVSQLTRSGYVSAQVEALMFVAHFIGDLHQPLHVSYADDAGGNFVVIKLKGVNSSLHRLWDRQLLSEQPWRAMAKQLLAQLSSAQISQWQQVTDVDVWANESLQITRNIYQQLPHDRVITDEYVIKNRLVLFQRMQMAGVRIAALLEDVFNES